MAEILFGHLVTHPRPAPRHSVAASALGHALGPPFQSGSGGPGGWILMDEPELHLGRMLPCRTWQVGGVTVADPPETAWIEMAPDWVCEILSPSTERYDRGDKRIIYGDAGVGHLWHVDPVLRMLEVFELRGGKWLLLDVYRDNADVAAPPFADVSFPLGLLWPFDPPAEGQA